jgi:hypothetical protein
MANKYIIDTRCINQRSNIIGKGIERSLIFLPKFIKDFKFLVIYIHNEITKDFKTLLKLENMINNYTSEQVWEAMEVLFPNDIDMFISHCNREFEWDYDKDIFDIIETLSDDAFINEVEMVFSQDDISTMESWLDNEYNII